MILRSIIGGAIALLLSGAAGHAETDTRGYRDTLPNHLVVPAPDGLPGVFAGRPKGEVRYAQAGDPRLTALEEQVRQLSGTIEELNFQILQMQEQMRKMQEDNEFRFQEIEQKKSDAGPVAGPKAAQAAGGEVVVTLPKQDRAVLAPETSTEIVEGGAALDPEASSKTFGTIVFDKDGNVIGADGKPLPDGQADGTIVAALPSTNDPEELYRNAYQFILSGDYGTAEAGFREHIDRFPADARASDAHFWLGEALLGQKKFNEAAEIFLAANRDYPSSKKAPDMLLKLGVSLAGMNQRDVACATFAEIGKRYPSAPPALRERVKQEKALAAC